MRDILFRGKRVDNGEWIYGYYAFYESLDRYCIYTGVPCAKDTMDFGGKQWEIMPETVGEYTGQKDKNGKMIFEGDIVQTKYGKAVIGFDQCRGFGGYSDKRGIIGGLVFLTGCDLSFGEVIGNIHDNKELLEIKNELHKERP